MGLNPDHKQWVCEEQNRLMEKKKEIPKSTWDVDFSDSEFLEKQTYEIVKNVAEYAIRENIKNIVLLDRSARPMATALREYWKTKNEINTKKGLPKLPEMPHIYFINPQGLKTTDKEFISTNVDKFAKTKQNKNKDKEEDPSLMRTWAQAKEDFLQTYKTLLQDKDAPLLIYDNCIHTSLSIMPVIEMFKEAGFSENNLKVGATFTEYDADVKSDMPSRSQEPVKVQCSPLGLDSVTNKTYTSVLSKVDRDPGIIKKDRNNRKRLQIAIKFWSLEESAKNEKRP